MFLVWDAGHFGSSCFWFSYWARSSLLCYQLIWVGLLLGSELSEKTVRRKIADAFEKLRGVGVAREELQQFRCMDVFDRCRETGLKNVPDVTTWPICEPLCLSRFIRCTRYLCLSVSILGFFACIFYYLVLVLFPIYPFGDLSVYLSVRLFVSLFVCLVQSCVSIILCHATFPGMYSKKRLLWNRPRTSLLSSR